MNKRILIIDDEAALRRVIQLTLKMTAGWEVLTASSGWEGIKKAETEQPDAILLDMMMPELDGVQTLKQLRSNLATQKIPVILLTAKMQTKQQNRFEQLGATTVFNKPFDPIMLAQQIANSLEWKLES